MRLIAIILINVLTLYLWILTFGIHFEILGQTFALGVFAFPFLTAIGRLTVKLQGKANAEYIAWGSFLACFIMAFFTFSWITAVAGGSCFIISRIVKAIFDRYVTACRFDGKYCGYQSCILHLVDTYIYYGWYAIFSSSIFWMENAITLASVELVFRIFCIFVIFKITKKFAELLAPIYS